MRFTRAFIVIAALLVAVQALAQQSILQGGPWAKGHVPQYIQPGFGQPAVQDGGGSGGGGLGANPNELGVTSESYSGTYPAANSGNGPNAEHVCFYDAPTTNPTGFHYLCLDPNAQGGGLLSYGFGGGATPLPFHIMVNGSLVSYPSLSSDNAWTGANSFAGPTTFTGPLSASGTATFSGSTTFTGAVTFAGSAVISTGAQTNAELRAFAPGIVPSVTRAGYLTPGDSPLLNYAWEATCSGIPDNIALYVSPLAGGVGCWSAAADPNVWNVLSWGAVADGRTFPDASTSTVSGTTTLVSGIITPRTVSISIASPAVVTMSSGMAPSVGEPINFASTGALPTGITAGTTYYVLALGLTIDTFEISASPTGAPINTSGTQSGVQSITSPGMAAFTSADVGRSVNIPLAGGSYSLSTALVTSTIVPTSFNAAGFIKAAPGGSIANPYVVGDTATLAVTGGTCATAPVVTAATVKLVAAALGSSGGTGYPLSSTFNVYVTSGTWAVPAQVSVTTNGAGVVTTVNGVTNSGRATAQPTMTNSATDTAQNQTGSGLLLNLGTGLDIVTVTTPGSCSVVPTTNPLTIASTSGSGTGASVIAYFTAPSLSTTIASVTDGQRAVLTAAATVDAPFGQTVGVYTPNDTSLGSAISALAGDCLYFPGSNRLYGFSGRLSFVQRSACITGDGAPTGLSSGQISPGSWILAAHEDSGVYFRSALPIAAYNDATGSLSKFGVIRPQVGSLTNGVYVPNVAQQCDIYNEKALKAFQIVTYNGNCGMRVRSSAGPMAVTDWQGQPLTVGLQGDRNGDTVHINMRHFSFFWSNGIAAHDYIAAYMRNNSDASLMGATTDFYYDSDFTFGYRAQYHATSPVGGIAGCPTETRVSGGKSDNSTMVLYVDYTSICNSRALSPKGWMFSNISANSWSGVTSPSTINNSSGYNIDVEGQNTLVSISEFRSFRSVYGAILVAGANNLVTVGTAWTQFPNRCAASSAGCDDGAAAHWNFSVQGATNTLQFLSMPDFATVGSLWFDAEAGGVLGVNALVDAYVQYSTTVVVPNNASTVIPFDTVVTDTTGGWSNPAHRYTAKVPGNYLVCAQMTANSDVAAGPINQVLFVTKNGFQAAASIFGVPTGTTVYVPQSACAEVYLNGVSDYVAATITTATGATNVHLYGQLYSTWLRASRVGP